MRPCSTLAMLAGMWPLAARAADTDLDGLDDVTEVGLGTDPARADTDGDRFSDGGEVRVLLTDPLVGNPICEWPAHPITSSGGSSTSVWPVDLDVDGDLDVLDAGSFDEVNAWENLGQAGFVKHLLARDHSWLVRAGDLDGDGIPDVVVSTGSQVWVVHHRGGFAFGPAAKAANLERAETVAVEDMDLDGDLDLVAWANLNDIPYVYSQGVLLENLGGGRFSAPFVFHEHPLPAGLTVGDLDNDGWPDVLAGGYYDVWWHRNEGPQGPLSPAILINEIGPHDSYDTGLSMADLDGDGWSDVVYPDWSRQLLTVIWNGGGTGGGAFGPSVPLDQRTTVEVPFVQSAWPGDVDGDGDLDVLVYQPSPIYRVGWVENRGGRSLGSVEAVAGGAYFYRGATADMDSDGDVDLVLPGMYEDTAWIENIGAGDPDADGLDSRDEVCFSGTQARVADTDGGGVADGVELSVGRNPLDPADDGDSDGDGIPTPIDCDDGDLLVHPGAPEVCGNGADDDCDTLVDEGC